MIHTCQLSDRAYRTIHFRLGGGEGRWIGEQQSFRSGRTFEDGDAGTVLEELILDYETEPVAGYGQTAVGGSDLTDPYGSTTYGGSTYGTTPGQVR